MKYKNEKEMSEALLLFIDGPAFDIYYSRVRDVLHEVFTSPEILDTLSMEMILLQAIYS